MFYKFADVEKTELTDFAVRIGSIVTIEIGYANTIVERFKVISNGDRVLVLQDMKTPTRIAHIVGDDTVYHLDGGEFEIQVMYYDLQNGQYEVKFNEETESFLYQKEKTTFVRTKVPVEVGDEFVGYMGSDGDFTYITVAAVGDEFMTMRLVNTNQEHKVSYALVDCNIYKIDNDWIAYDTNNVKLIIEQSQFGIE